MTPTTPSRRSAGQWLAAFALLLLLSGCLPIPAFTTSPSTLQADSNVAFDASSTIVSNIPEDTVAVRYEWDFGDGGTGRGAEVDHVYDEPGTYTVALTVTDSAGRTGTMTDTVTIEAASTTDATDASTTEDDDTGTTDTTPDQTAL